MYCCRSRWISLYLFGIPLIFFFLLFTFVQQMITSPLELSLVHTRIAMHSNSIVCCDTDAAVESIVEVKKRQLIFYCSPISIVCLSQKGINHYEIIDISFKWLLGSEYDCLTSKYFNKFPKQFTWYLTIILQANIYIFIVRLNLIVF